MYAIRSYYAAFRERYADTATVRRVAPVLDELDRYPRADREAQ